MGRKTNRVLALIIVTILLITLCACGETPVAPTSGTEASEITESTGTTAATEMTTEATTENGYSIPEVIGTSFAEISEDELKDKVLGAWIGKCIAVGWASSIEFAGKGYILQGLPKYNISMPPTCYTQDDLYAMLPFMLTMYENGINSEMDLYAEAFKNTTFSLWHANKAARDNLNRGLKYPESGSYKNNPHYDDIDWQIDCDFIGITYPGLPYISAKQSFDMGQIICYGDGVYGGSFICAMHSAAYTAKNVREIVGAGYDVIADNTVFKEVIGSVLKVYDEGGKWEDAWQVLQDRWGTGDVCPEYSQSAINIDAKLNSGYVAIGVLWGNGDFADTVTIAGRCGQDADCNAATAGSICGNMIGAKAIGTEWYIGTRKNGDTYDVFLERDRKFTGTDYNIYDCADINFELVLRAFELVGAYKTEDGIWHIPVENEVRQVPYQQVK